MKLYLVRHGETDTNADGLMNGINDISLNEKGMEQARLLSEKVKNIDYDFIICSPLLRAKQTAEIINAKNKDIIYDNRIVERDAGVFTLTKVPADESDWWNRYPKKDYANAERVDEVLKRTYEFLDDIKKEYFNKNILVVTHGGVLKCMFTYFNYLPEDGNLSIISYKNCEIVEYDI